MNSSLSCLFTNNIELDTKCLFNSYEGTSDFKECFYDCFGVPYDFVCSGISKDKFIYDLLCENYRNDFFIRYSFYDKVLSKSKAISFFELPILNSRIDVVSINGKSVAYEIKTEYDTLDRLEKQINDYSKAFEYIYVICSSEMIDDVEPIIPNHCGIYVYSGKNRIVYSKYKEATVSPHLDIKCMLSLMLKKERLLYFKDNDIDNISKTYDFASINNVFKKALKLRFDKKSKEISIKCNLFK